MRQPRPTPAHVTSDRRPRVGGAWFVVVVCAALLLSARPSEARRRSRGAAAATVASQPTVTADNFRALERDLVSHWQGPWLPDLPTPKAGERFWVIGSSSVAGNLGRLMVDRLHRLGFDAKRHGASATGFSRPDFFDWWAEVDKLPLSDKVAGVLIYMGVNDPQGIWLHPGERKQVGKREVWLRFHEKGWGTIYRQRVTSLIDRICARGVRRVIILPPADVRGSWLHGKLRRIRRLQIAGAQASKCGAVVSAAGDTLFLKDRFAERRDPRRMPDGYHLSTYGADIVWQRIRGHLLHRVGGLPRPVRLQRHAAHTPVVRPRRLSAPSARRLPAAPAR